MARRKKHNPELRLWRGVSYSLGRTRWPLRIRELRDQIVRRELARDLGQVVVR